MAVSVGSIRLVAHLPLFLGMLRKLEGAAIIDTLLPPHPANVVSCGRGMESLLLAILDRHHALYKVGTRLDERGILPLLQEDVRRESLNAYHKTRTTGVDEAHTSLPIRSPSRPTQAHWGRRTADQPTASADLPM